MALFTLPPNPRESDGDLGTLFGETPTLVRGRTLPAEWYTQGGVWLTWPHEDTDWADMLSDITETYIRLAYEIARREPLLIVHPRAWEIKALLHKRLSKKVAANIHFFSAPTNDTWTRDHGILCVLNDGAWELVDCAFNGWGGKFPAELDNALSANLVGKGVLQGRYVNALNFVLEGGSIESDGAGTILTTEQCVCTSTRGEGRGREFIESKFAELFGTQHVLWLQHGHLEGDDTDGHIDTLARFCPGGVIAYVKCSDKSDTHYEDLKAMEDELKSLRNQNGEPYKLVPLPMAPACYDTDGSRLPATYANFLILSSAVIYPTYGDDALDEQARKVLLQLFPKYDLVPIDARHLIRQHGSIHCAAMQLPRGALNKLISSD